ncbi:MAG TPA: MFS transporter, partial [Terriglobales bacterium]|nr:MFS transporter [Terriglobales bacterium]
MSSTSSVPSEDEELIDSNQKGHSPRPESRRGFWALIVTQFQGAYSSNVLQYLLLGMILGMGLKQAERDRLVPMVMALFSTPFILFSMAGGFLADRFSKRQVTICTKLLELGSMALATFGLAIHSILILLVSLFLVGTQAALFGPSKYGMLPELLSHERLSWGNGVLELGTFLAIISGTITGGVLAERLHGSEFYAGFFLLALAVVGTLTSMGIVRLEAAAPTKRFQPNFFADLWNNIARMKSDRALFLAVLGNAYFWFLGSLLVSTTLVYGSDILHIGTQRTAYLNTALSIGIGLGSVAAGYLSAGKIEYGLIPIGSLGMTVAGVAVGMSHGSFVTIAALLAAIGLFAGFFAVPVNALIQHRPNPEEKGGIIAAANLLSFAGIALSAGAYYVFTRIGHLDPRGVFLAAAAITAAGTIYVLMLLPEWFLRLVLWFATNTIYRITVLGREKFPEKGGALLVSNHMSFVDALLLVAATDRPIRFLIFQDIYEMPLVKPWAKLGGAIPISSEQRPRDMIRSLRTASEAIRNGEIVCIFAEGQITRTGQLLPFRRGFERIMKGVDAPIIPVSLDGVWGSIFSFHRGRFLWKMPQRIPYPVTVSFGDRLP